MNGGTRALTRPFCCLRSLATSMAICRYQNSALISPWSYSMPQGVMIHRPDNLQPFHSGTRAPRSPFIASASRIAGPGKLPVVLHLLIVRSDTQNSSDNSRSDFPNSILAPPVDRGPASAASRPGSDKAEIRYRALLQTLKAGSVDQK